MDYLNQFIFYSVFVYGDVCIYDGAVFDPVTLSEYMEAKGLKYDRSEVKYLNPYEPKAIDTDSPLKQALKSAQIQ